MEAQNVMTRGFAAEIERGNFSAKIFATLALVKISANEPSMIVAKPGVTKPYFEDDGRTLVVACHADSPKFYACINETGGATLMLADEY